MKKVNVVFRKFEDGEVIAIFPNIYPVAKDSKAEVMSYMHVGLKKELEMIGYSVNVL